MPISDNWRTAILCTKEVAVIVIEGAAVSRIQGIAKNKMVKISEQGCFIAGTLVQTDTGLRPIEKIEVGNVVLSRDTETGELSWRNIVRIFSFRDREIIEIEFENGDGGKEKISATTEHPFWVKNGGWIGARELLPGDEVFTSRGGWLRVTGSTWLSKTQKVYNFEVENIHNYFVGEFGIWVHNASYIVSPKRSQKLLPSPRIKGNPNRIPDYGPIYVDKKGNAYLTSIPRSLKEKIEGNYYRLLYSKYGQFISGAAEQTIANQSNYPNSLPDRGLKNQNRGRF